MLEVNAIWYSDNRKFVSWSQQSSYCLKQTKNGLYHQTKKQLSRRVEQNSELKRGNYGRISSNGIYFWTRGIYSRGKTYKDLKRKRNARRELQGRVIHSVTVVCSAIYRSMELITT